MNKSIFNLPEGIDQAGREGQERRAGGARAHSDYPDYGNN